MTLGLALVLRLTLILVAAAIAVMATAAVMCERHSDRKCDGRCRCNHTHDDRLDLAHFASTRGSR